MAETIVGHVPREMSRTFWHFVRHGSSIGCEVTEQRMFGKGLKIAGGEGRINEGDTFTIPIISMWKIGGGRINEGGHSDSRLQYMLYMYTAYMYTAYIYNVHVQGEVHTCIHVSLGPYTFIHLHHYVHGIQSPSFLMAISLFSGSYQGRS